MNRKYLLLGLVAILAVGLAWVGRSLYRARSNRVTIDVYSTQLSTVVNQLKRQTRETILVGKGLESKVTLTARNQPLDEVLDTLTRQAGANWSKWHAVHGSQRALTQLETALRDGAKIEEVGWTNIAPQDIPGVPDWHPSPGGTFQASAVGPATGEASVTRRKPVTIRLDSNDLKDENVEAAVREQLKAAGVEVSANSQPGTISGRSTVDVDVQAARSGSDAVGNAGAPRNRIRMVTRSRDGTGKVIEEVWSPERVVLEQRLQSRLGDQAFPDPSDAVAREIAGKVKGQWTTLYVLRPSPGGLPFAGKRMRQLHTVSGGDTNAVPGEPPPPPDIESAVRRAEAERFTRLTPEQRVERAREKRAMHTP